jgi:D-alanyl-D-alanine carboxypeptidase
MHGQLNEAFENTAAFTWLSENAYQYGFILRYPKSVEQIAITGYDYEPWHYRFVGRFAATEIHMGGLTLEEYLGEG